jgi:hypothetical protein
LSIHPKLLAINLVEQIDNLFDKFAYRKGSSQASKASMLPAMEADPSAV